MKVYEMLQALEIVNQLNVALGQNEQCLKIYLSHEDEKITIQAMNQRHYYEKCIKLGIDKHFMGAIASTEYDSEVTIINYRDKAWELEIYSGWDWEVEE